MIIEVLDKSTLKVLSYGTVLTNSYEIKSDIYTIEYTTFQVLNVNVKKGDIIYIKEINYLGVVNNREKTNLDEVIEIQCAELDELINIEIPAVAFTGVVATNLALYLTQLFVSNQDPYQDGGQFIPKMKFINDSNVSATISFEKDKATTVHDLLVKAFEVAGVYHTFNITTDSLGQYKEIEVHFKSNDSETITLKTDFSAIRSFSYTDNLSQNENKIEFFLSSEDGGSGIVANAIRYLLEDDTITDSSTAPGRILPVKTKIKYYRTTDLTNNPNYFTDTAAQELKGNAYNHLIEMMMLTNNKIAVPLVDFKLYSKVTFIDGENIYHTILTGYKQTQDKSIIELTFGKVRKGLIEKLKRGIKW